MPGRVLIAEAQAGRQLVWGREFQALTIGVEIHLESEALVPAIVALTGSYPTSSSGAQLHYFVRGTAAPYAILCEGVVIDESASAIDVPSIIELDMLRHCIVEAVDSVVLHAAAVTVSGATLVMVGPSGAGKTTLTRAMLQTGAAYRSDECVAINSEGQVQGLARPIYLEQDNVAGFKSSAVHRHEWLDAQSNVVRDRLWHPEGGGKDRMPGTLSSLVVVAYAADAKGRLEPLTAGEAMTRLWPCVLNPRPASLEILTGLLQRYPVSVVHSASVDAACTLVRRGLAAAK